MCGLRENDYAGSQRSNGPGKTGFSTQKANTPTLGLASRSEGFFPPDLIGEPHQDHNGVRTNPENACWSRPRFSTRRNLTLRPPAPNGRAAATSQSTSPAPDDLEAAADQTIAACGGNAREASKALIVANGFLEKQIEELRAAVSTGYSRGRYEVLRDRMDWYD